MHSRSPAWVIDGVDISKLLRTALIAALATLLFYLVVNLRNLSETNDAWWIPLLITMLEGAWRWARDNSKPPDETQPGI